MRRLGELPFIASLRDALPWSFIGLAAAFLGILIAELVGGTLLGETLGLRVASALLPAFGVMAATLVVILPIRLARAMSTKRTSSGRCPMCRRALPAR